MQAILYTAANADTAAEAAAAARFFDAFFCGNADAQEAWASSLSAVSVVGTKSSASPLGELIAASLTRDAPDVAPNAVVAAAATLRAMLQGCPAAQARALSAGSAESGPSLPSHLLRQVAKALSVPVASGGAPPAALGPSSLPLKTPKAAAQKMADEAVRWLPAALLCTLAIWAYECRLVSTILLSDPGPISALLLALPATGDSESATVAGLAAVVLGFCAAFGDADDAGGGLGATGVLPMVAQHVGMPAFFAALDGLQNDLAQVCHAHAPVLVPVD